MLADEKTLPFEISPTLTEKQRGEVKDWAGKQALREFIKEVKGNEAAEALQLDKMNDVFWQDIDEGAPVAVRTNPYRLKTTGEFAFDSWSVREDPQGDTSVREQLVYTNGGTVEEHVASGPRTLVEVATVTIVDVQTTGFRDKQFREPRHTYWVYLTEEGKKQINKVRSPIERRAEQVFELQNLCERTGEFLNTLPKARAWQVVHDALIPSTVLDTEPFSPQEDASISFVRVFPATDLRAREFTTIDPGPSKGNFWEPPTLGSLHRIVFTDGRIAGDEDRGVNRIERASVAVVRYTGDDLKGHRRRDNLLVFVDGQAINQIVQELTK